MKTIARGVSRFRRPILHLSLLAAAVFGPHALHAEDIFLEMIEAEVDYLATHNEGGRSIVPVICGGASNNFAIAGLDRPGDWIEYEIHLSADACFVDSVRSRGEKETYREYELLFFPAGETEPQAYESLRTPVGRGLE